MTELSLGMATLLVPDYDEAIAFFVDILGLDLMSDDRVSDTKRWIEVGRAGGMRLLLAKAANDAQREAVGNQAGGRVGFFLHTSDFAASYDRLKRAGVNFVEQPRREAYGAVVVFEDPFGNRWDLLEARNGLS